MGDKSDFLTEIKKILNKLYKNKLFRFAVFAVFLIFCFNKYSSIEENIRNFSRNKNNQDKPVKIQKTEVVKHVADTIFVKTHNKVKSNEDAALIAERRRAEAEKREIEKREKIEAMENLKKEFAKKENNKNRIVKYNDEVKLKMIITNGEEFDVPMQPINMDLKVTKDKGNIFAEYVVGKRVEDVAVIPLKTFIDKTNFMQAAAKVEEENGVKDITSNYYSLIETSPMVYRVKIMEIKN